MNEKKINFEIVLITSLKLFGSATLQLLLATLEMVGGDYTTVILAKIWRLGGRYPAVTLFQMPLITLRIAVGGVKRCI